MITQDILYNSTEDQISLWCALCSTRSVYFLAKEIFMAVVGVILKPWSASLAAADCISFSNSTKAMSCRPGTSRT